MLQQIKRPSFSPVVARGFAPADLAVAKRVLSHPQMSKRLDPVLTPLRRKLSKQALAIQTSFGGMVRRLHQAAKKDGPLEVAVQGLGSINADQGIVHVEPSDGPAVGFIDAYQMDWLVKNEEEKMDELRGQIAELEPLAIEVEKALSSRLLSEALEGFARRIHSEDLTDLLESCAKKGATKKKKKKLGKADLRYLRSVKANGDQLRAALRLVDTSGDVPPPLHQLVRDIGRLKDAGKNELAKKELARRARIVLDRMEAIDLSELEGEIDPATRQSTKAKLAHRLRHVRQQASKGVLSADSYHGVRKHLRDILDLCRLLRQVGKKGDPRIADLERTLEKLNKLLGHVHDRLVQLKEAGIPYEKLQVELPQRVVDFLYALTKRIEPTASSRPENETAQPIIRLSTDPGD